MKKLYGVFILFLSFQAFSWNNLGHRLVAQIALNNMTMQSRQLANRYNHALDSVYKPLSLVNAAPWLDSLRSTKDLALLKKHYINLPFSMDNTTLIPPQKMNAAAAIEEAKSILQSESVDDFDKGFNLRILLHVVGDIHQPLHTTSQFSKIHPLGDKGGNLLRLAKNPIAGNLHSYWDRGGGFLLAKSNSKSWLKRKAAAIESLWPCSLEKMEFNPQKWAEESHQIAVEKAYLIQEGQKPDKNYQYMVKRLTEQQIALAGCRLAATLGAVDNWRQGQKPS